MMRHCTPLLAVLALYIPHAHLTDIFCTDYDLEIEEQWPPYTQCLIEAETIFSLDIGVPQKFIESEITLEEFIEEYNLAAAYLTAVAENEDLRHVLPYCRNEHELCIQWAAQGWCEDDPHYMESNCCPACASAEQIQWLIECPMDPKAPHAWKPGDLNHFFLNLTMMKQYEPRVHSRPLLPGDPKDAAAADRDFILGPWVVTLENVVSKEEANTLIEWADDYGWRDSLVAGTPKEDGIWEAVLSEDRTSRLAWCREECMEDPTVARVLDRLSNITNIHSNHSDYLQLLNYESGEFYRTHHDFHHYQVYSSSGPRIMTIYIYLKDVSNGGGTRFPDLDITVTPKLGRALIWPNVLNENPDEEDERTRHEALPPIGDEKYGATLWWHQRDFKTAHAVGCAQ